MHNEGGLVLTSNWLSKVQVQLHATRAPYLLKTPVKRDVKAPKPPIAFPSLNPSFRRFPNDPYGPAQSSVQKSWKHALLRSREGHDSPVGKSYDEQKHIQVPYLRTQSTVDEDEPNDEHLEEWLTANRERWCCLSQSRLQKLDNMITQRRCRIGHVVHQSALS